MAVCRGNGDRDYARRQFEEDPAAFLGDRQWLLRADQDGNLYARAMCADETIVQMEELGQVIDAFSTLEGFVNRRELRMAFPADKRASESSRQKMTPSGSGRH